MTDNARMLEALSDGRRWSTGELLNLHLTPHSRKSELGHTYGYGIVVTRESGRHGEKPIYWYLLLTVPAEPSPLEAVIDLDAARRLEAMRDRGHTLASAPLGEPARSGSAADIGEPEQAIDATEKVSLSLSPEPAAGRPLSTAGPTFAELLVELRAIDDEIVTLRDRVLLGIEDSSLLDDLLQARKEIDAALRDLEECAAA